MKKDFDFTEIIANIPQVIENREKMKLRNKLERLKNIPIITTDIEISNDIAEINLQIIEFIKNHDLMRDDLYKYILTLNIEDVDEKIKTSIKTLTNSRYKLRDSTLDFWINFFKYLKDDGHESE
jgi:hypothetical protein